MDGTVLLKWLEAAVAPAVFLAAAWAMLEPKCSRRAALGALGGFLAVELAAQGVIFALGRSPELVFTLWPLTLYLPAVVGLHLLSKNRFLPTALVWLSALLCDRLLLALQKLLNVFFAARGGMVWAWAVFGVLLASAVVLVALVLRFLRRPFLACAGELEGSWTAALGLPVMLLALYSYFLAGTTDVGALILLLFTALAAFAVMVRLMASLARERRDRETRLQLEAMRRDCELLRKKLELGRNYRHDMRHHMAALSGLLGQGDCDAAARYVAGWQGRLAQVEMDDWCRNAAVNAVLSTYLARAREAGCRVEAKVALPEALPVEDLDLCVVLANALENAVHACEKAPRGAPRQLGLELGFSDRRLTLRVENSCYETVLIGDDGLPGVPRRDGHGQGLRSIAAVAEKYHGMARCECQDGTFILRVVLLNGAQPPKKARRTPAVCASVLLGLFFLNCMPALADALETVPVLGRIVRVVDVRAYALSWGDTGIAVTDPVLEGDDGAVAGLDARKDAFIDEMQGKFVEYAARKYRGYVAEDISYDVVRDDEALLVLRFRATLNAGGSVDYSRYITLDKGTGRVLDLSGLFLPESNYIFPISREIEAQMAERVKAGEGDYFIPGGIWSEEECFRSIDPEQNFYIDDSGRLVIVFGEYEVAPGSEGEPEFVIPAELLDGLLAQPSVLG